MPMLTSDRQILSIWKSETDVDSVVKQFWTSGGSTTEKKNIVDIKYENLDQGYRFDGGSVLLYVEQFVGSN